MTALGRRGVMLALALCACKDPEPHTYIPAFSPKELATFGVSAPVTIMHAGSALTKPPGGPLHEGDEKPMLAGPATQRGTQEPGRRAGGFRPDRVTELSGTLGYFEVFTPAITPFKRDTGAQRARSGAARGGRTGPRRRAAG
jgi:hypothetical protein